MSITQTQPSFLMINILLTFTGFHDPYALGLLGEEQQQGPILSLIKERPFDRAYLFSTPNTAKNTTETRNVLRKITVTGEMAGVQFMDFHFKKAVRHARSLSDFHDRI